MASNDFVSFIFLDMETTGIGRPIEITELGLVAIQKHHLLAASRSELGISTPRIFDKLHLCVRPVKDIEVEASRLTRITGEDLSQKKAFDKQLACMIRAFVLRQPQPACLVAHWGDRYDFDILASQFTSVGSEFPSTVPVSDSYKAFKKLHKATHGKLRGKRRLGIRGVSFSLSNLYKREIGCYIKGRYTVEGDSMALVELVLKMPEVLEYIESGAHPMGRGEKNQPSRFDIELESRRNECRKTAFVDLTVDL